MMNVAIEINIEYDPERADDTEIQLRTESGELLTGTDGKWIALE